MSLDLHSDLAKRGMILRLVEAHASARDLLRIGFVAHMLKLPPLVWQTRALNRPTFGIAPLTFAPQPCLTIN
jgi:hypothetical protein